MIGGNLAEGSIPKNLSFELIIDTVRRKKIMDALMSTNIEKKNAGKFVLEVKTHFFKIILFLYFLNRLLKEKKNFLKSLKINYN